MIITLRDVLVLARACCWPGGVMVLWYVADTDEKALRKRIDSERIR